MGDRNQDRRGRRPAGSQLQLAAGGPGLAIGDSRIQQRPLPQRPMAGTQQRPLYIGPTRTQQRAVQPPVGTSHRPVQPSDGTQQRPSQPPASTHQRVPQPPPAIPHRPRQALTNITPKRPLALPLPLPLRTSDTQPHHPPQGPSPALKAALLLEGLQTLIHDLEAEARTSTENDYRRTIAELKAVAVQTDIAPVVAELDRDLGTLRRHWYGQQRVKMEGGEEEGEEEGGPGLGMRRMIERLEGLRMVCVGFQQR